MEYIDQLLTSNAAGMVLCSVCLGNGYRRLLESYSKPLITIVNKLFEYPHVGIDDRLALSDAVDYITGQGYESILYYCPDPENLSNHNIYIQKQRYEGFLDGAQNNKISSGNAKRFFYS